MTTRMLLKSCAMPPASQAHRLQLLDLPHLLLQPGLLGHVLEIGSKNQIGVAFRLNRTADAYGKQGAVTPVEIGLPTLNLAVAFQHLEQAATFFGIGIELG